MRAAMDPMRDSGVRSVQRRRHQGSCQKAETLHCAMAVRSSTVQLGINSYDGIFGEGDGGEEMQVVVCVRFDMDEFVWATLLYS